jgi:hypothetical protein
MKRSLLFMVLALPLAASAGALDFGLLLSSSGNYSSGVDSAGFGLSGTLAPWLSVSIGKNTSLYLSGKVTLKGFEYGKNAWTWPLAELERTELSFRPARTVYLTLGRHQFRDNAGMIASGLFDGLTGNFGLGKVRLAGGVYYTGWLYKGTAEVLMTQPDGSKRAAPLDYGNFLNTYFASSRMLVSLAGDFPDLSSRTSLSLNALGQFDLNDYRDTGAAPLHSQYLQARYGIEAADSLRFTLTAAGGLAESGENDARFCLAAAFGADWELPGGPADLLGAELRWGSGAVSDALGPFRPVSGISQGSVFTPTLSGTANIRASYAARFHSALSFNSSAVLFLRTDVETFRDTELDPASTKRFLGGEFYGKVVWAPQSVLYLSIGGGVFFPGGAFTKAASPRWNVNMELVLSL